MNVGKRAFLYLTRKKGKNLLLGIVFLLISFSLLTGSAFYLGIRQVSEDLRSDIGASFNIRPYEQFDVNNGQVSSKGTPVMDEQSIRRVISIVGKELKCYNTEHSGYVKGENLSFLAGTGHSEESNMGTVKAAVSYTHLLMPRKQKQDIRLRRMYWKSWLRNFQSWIRFWNTVSLQS